MKKINYNYRLLWSFPLSSWIVVDSLNPEWDKAITFDELNLMGSDVCEGYYKISLNRKTGEY